MALPCRHVFDESRLHRRPLVDSLQRQLSVALPGGLEHYEHHDDSPTLLPVARLSSGEGVLQEEREWDSPSPPRRRVEREWDSHSWPARPSRARAWGARLADETKAMWQHVLNAGAADSPASEAALRGAPAASAGGGFPVAGAADSSASEAALRGAPAASAGGGFPIDDLPHDVLREIIGHVQPDRAYERLQACGVLARTSRSLRDAMHRIPAESLTEAATDLMASARVHPEAPEQQLLDLSARQLGAFECRLIAHAMAAGTLPPATTSMWLQHNSIGATGLRWLARGVRSLPSDSTLRSISLGANAWRCEREGYIAERRRVARAAEKLEAAAASRRACIRWNS